MEIKVEYYSLIDYEKSPGVAKKLNNAVKALNNIGYNALGCFFNISLLGVTKMLFSALRSNADVVFFRYSLLFAPLMSLVTLVLRLRGKKVVTDIPTPRVVLAREISSEKKPISYIKSFILLISGPWVLWPSNKVIQYAGESDWFSFGLKKKTILLGNGVVVEDLPLSSSCKTESNALEIIAVALIAYWHGYDRLLRAIDLLGDEYRNCIHVTIVGDGDELSNLQKLSSELGLSNVHFTGMLSGQQLDEIYDKAHVGVSSLGLHRKGIFEASDLKTREYVARGLLVLGSGKDADFNDNSLFRKVVPCDESIEPIVEQLKALMTETLPDKNLVRAFAKSQVSMESKMKLIMTSLAL